MPAFESQLKVIMEWVNPPSQFAGWLKTLDAKEVEDVALLAASEEKFDALFDTMVAGELDEGTDVPDCEDKFEDNAPDF